MLQHRAEVRISEYTAHDDPGSAAEPPGALGVDVLDPRQGGQHLQLSLRALSAQCAGGDGGRQAEVDDQSDAGEGPEGVPEKRLKCIYWERFRRKKRKKREIEEANKK